MDDDEIEECTLGGLRRSDVTPDHSVSTIMSREKCFCKNRRYGCTHQQQWKKLQDHESECSFKPVKCPNDGCSEQLAFSDVTKHQEQCPHTLTQCSYCKLNFARKYIEDHVSECDSAETQCFGCGKTFPKRKQLIMHQKISAACLTRPGKCFYFDYCGFKSESVDAMQKHLITNMSDHLEWVTMKTEEVNTLSNKVHETHAKEMKVAVNAKVRPLEKITLNLAMKISEISNKMETSDTSGDHLVTAMKRVHENTQSMETVQSKVAQIERQIKDSGLDRVTVIESHSQSLRRHNEQLNDIEKRMKDMEVASHDGTLIWKIKEYKRRKGDAVRGRQMSIYSHPFYTSKNGYKMCLRTYINGDGLGRGKCLSLFFVIMKGDYDELLSFPFKQRVTFSLLFPRNPQLSKHETFLPDPESSSFRRPQTEMNVASGCPQFALHSEVESSTFLINDCIYIRARVEVGGDTIL